MKVLISGICGFVGSAVTAFLREAQPALELIGIDNLMRPGSETNRRLLGAMDVEFIHGDLRCASDFETLPAVDWVIDAAANPSVRAGVDGRSSSRQVVEHNLGGTVNLLEYCRKVSSGFILLSTNRVYSIPSLASMPLVSTGNRFAPDTAAFLPTGCSPQGIRSDFSTSAPVSLYGGTKLASEALALEYAEAFKLPVRINRCGVIGGAGQFGTAEQGIFSYWLHAWKAGRPLRYIGFDGLGKQVRDVFHPRDLGRLLLEQMHDPGRNCPPILNIGGGLENSMSIAELSRWCTERFGPREVGQDLEARPYDLPWLVMDNAEMNAAWGWKPLTGLPALLEEIAEHVEANPAWLSLSGA